MTRKLLLLPCAALFAQQAHVNLDWAPHRNTDHLNPFGASVVSPEVIRYLLIGFGTNEELPLGMSASVPRGRVAERSRALHATLDKHGVLHEFYSGRWRARLGHVASPAARQAAAGALPLAAPAQSLDLPPVPL